MSNISNSDMPHAAADQPAPPKRPRGVAPKLVQVGTFPALLALGAGVIALERRRIRRERGRRNLEG